MEKEKRLERLEKMENKIISTVEDSLKRNMDFKGEIIKSVDGVREDQKYVLKKFKSLNEKLEEMNALNQELLKSIVSLEKERMMAGKKSSRKKKK